MFFLSNLVFGFVKFLLGKGYADTFSCNSKAITLLFSPANRWEVLYLLQATFMYIPYYLHTTN